MSDVVEVLSLTWHYVIRLSLWFMLALFITAMIDLLYLDVVAKRALRRNKGWVGVVSAASVGAFSPFCSFIVIPLIRKLLRGGVPLSAVMAFWVASPTMDPEIFALTAAQLGLPLATARLVGAVVLSVGAGFVVLAIQRRGMLTNVLRGDREDDRPRPEVIAGEPTANEQVLVAAGTAAPPAVRAASMAPASTSGTVAGAGAVPRSGTVPQAGVLAGSGAVADGGTCGSGGVGTPAASACGSPPDPDEDENTPWWPTAKASLRSRRNWRITFRNMGRDTVSLGKWLVAACLIEALLVLYVPTELIATLFGDENPVTSILMGALVGIPLYMNGAGAIPVVGGLLAKGMAPGAAVTFLLGGAVTTVPAIMAVRSIVRMPVFLLYLGVGVIGSILIGFVAQLVL